MSNIDSILKTYIERPNAFVFGFKKIHNQYVHTYCEGHLLEKFGLSPEMIINKTLFDFMSEEIAHRKEEFYQLAWQGENINYEGYINGIYYLAVLMPIIRNGKIEEVIATAFDITREKHNEQKMQQNEKLAVIGQLAAGVAHEIRNPLTSLKGFTQILDEKITDQTQRDYLQIMLRDLSNIQRVVDEFMLLSNPNKPFIMSKTNIQTLINNVIVFLRPEQNNIEMITDFQSPILAECDANQIKQVLYNLLQNAMDASTTKKGTIIVSLSTINDHFFEIGVKDFGKGISSERQKHLFEPFYTTKEKGTGMGLMVSKQIIELHSGTIQIESQENFGTFVKVRLPIYQQKSSN